MSKVKIIIEQDGAQEEISCNDFMIIYANSGSWRYQNRIDSSITTNIKGTQNLFRFFVPTAMMMQEMFEQK